MTVKELIERLQAFPPDATVGALDEGFAEDPDPRPSSEEWRDAPRYYYDRNADDWPTYFTEVGKDKFIFWTETHWRIHNEKQARRRAEYDVLL